MEELVEYLVWILVVGGVAIVAWIVVGFVWLTKTFIKRFLK